MVEPGHFSSVLHRHVFQQHFLNSSSSRTYPLGCVHRLCQDRPWKHIARETYPMGCVHRLCGDRHGKHIAWETYPLGRVHRLCEDRHGKHNAWETYPLGCVHRLCEDRHGKHFPLTSDETLVGLDRSLVCVRLLMLITGGACCWPTFFPLYPIFASLDFKMSTIIVRLLA
jgi:hypothetical protein